MNPPVAIERRALPLRDLALPSDGTVDVWQVRQDRMPLAGLGVLAATTEGAEGRQMERMQQQFLLRLLLGAYLGKPGRDLSIRREGAGKPVLAGDDGMRLAFSVSHTGPWLAIAVSNGVPLGIDIEPGDRPLRWQRLARRYFPADDAERLCACDEAEGRRRFLDHWTAREALIKAAGRTLAGNVGGIALEDDPATRQIAPRRLPSDWPQASRWRLCGLAPNPDDGLVGHVAWSAGVPPAVRRFELSSAG